MEQRDIPTFNIAEVSQALFERQRKVSAALGRKRKHIADAPDLSGLLTSGCKGSDNAAQ